MRQVGNPLNGREQCGCIWYKVTKRSSWNDLEELFLLVY